MKRLTLNRFAYHKHGTFGVLLEGTLPICLTLENQWKDNQVNVSCIPSGEHRMKRVDSPKFGDTFELIVSGRTHIVIHWGNTEDDTLGCLLTGTGLGVLPTNDTKHNPDVENKYKKGLSYSLYAFKQFLQFMEGHDEGLINIRDMSE